MAADPHGQAGVWLDEAVFARLVGSCEGGRVLLFKVADVMVDTGEEWSGPVEFRFARRNGGMVDLEFRRLL